MPQSKCSICGRAHDLIDMQVGFRYPNALLAIPESERDARCWGHESTDFLQIDQTRNFMRGTLEIPIIGYEHSFAWGVWAEVAEQKLMYYFKHFMDDLSKDPPFDASIANDIKGYGPTAGTRILVRCGDEHTRPTFDVTDEHHLLSQQQRFGVTEQWVYDALHDYGVGESR